MQDNKIIAEFMGMEHCYRPYDDGFMEVKENDSCVELEDLQYHTSWDWLIPVVQKLIDEYVSIDEQDEQDLQQSILYDKIDSVYQITLEIIEKYNSEDRG